MSNLDVAWIAEDLRTHLYEHGMVPNHETDPDFTFEDEPRGLKISVGTVYGEVSVKVHAKPDAIVRITSDKQVAEAKHVIDAAVAAYRSEYGFAEAEDAAFVRTEVR